MMSMSYRDFQQLMKQGKFKEAADYAENESLQNPTPSEFWLTQRARALVRGSEYKSALQIAQQALDLNPVSPYALAAKADALVGLKRFDEALEHFEELLDDSRLSWKGRRGILICLSGMRRWEELLQRLAGWDLSEKEAIPWRTRGLHGLDRIEEALRACGRWLELSPHDAQALWERTEMEIRQEGLEATLERMGRLARIPSLPPVYREIYASLCRRAGKPEEAVKIYDRMATQEGHIRAQKKQVFTMAKSGQEREAIPLLEELLRGEPEDMYLHSSYAAACKRIGEAERAINFYNKLLGLFPEARSLYGRSKNLQRHLEQPG
jgi:tetratricopeptide (TPR) repeat protein